jgi:hypothetical protein
VADEGPENIFPSSRMVEEHTTQNVWQGLVSALQGLLGDQSSVTFLKIAKNIIKNYQSGRCRFDLLTAETTSVRASTTFV